MLAREIRRFIPKRNFEEFSLRGVCCRLERDNTSLRDQVYSQGVSRNRLNRQYICTMKYKKK